MNHNTTILSDIAEGLNDPSAIVEEMNRLSSRSFTASAHSEEDDRHGVMSPDRPVPAASDGAGRPVHISGDLTNIETTIKRIWIALLGTEQVGLDDSFMELGGQSLQAVTVLSRIRDELKVELPITIMFETDLTVRTLAKAVLDQSGDTPVRG
jgi:fengycin family lipopeptide synthetase D